MSVTKNKTMKLDEVLNHLSASSGVFLKETVMDMFGNLVKLIRQDKPQGLAFLRTLGDSDFDILSTGLKDIPNFELIQVDDQDEKSIFPNDWKGLGFLITISPNFTCAIYWSNKTEDSYREFLSGLVFHTEGCQKVAHWVAEELGDDIVEKLNTIEVKPQQPDKFLALNLHMLQILENRQRQLKQAKEELKFLGVKFNDQERLAAVGQLCSVIAHEIRNPLGLIDLYAKLIEHEIEKIPTKTVEDKENLVQNLKLIRSASQDLEHILSELTSYSRPLTLEKSNNNVCEMIQDVFDMYKPKADECQIKLSLDIPKHDIHLHFDRVKVRQALLNLVKNAFEASKPETEIKIVLSPRKNDDKLYIKVYDQGCGIDERGQKKLFTPYFSTKGNGTGLGLAHSKKILQAHGGAVELLHTGPEGSGFAIVLPTSLSHPENN